MRRILPFFLILCCLFHAVPARSEDISPESVRVSLCDEIAAFRISHHATDLMIDSCLTAAAQRQAEYLAGIVKLTDRGPAGETIREQAVDAGYGGEKSFEISEARAKVWVDTDAAYLMKDIWAKETLSLRAIMMEGAQHIGIGIADAPDKHRYIVVMLAALSDGDADYEAVPTYDFRTPKPEISATPTLAPLITSTMNPDGGIYHQVRSGETFSEIAYAYGLDWYTLSVLNHIKLVEGTPVVVYEGDLLVIQPTFTMTPTPTATKTPLPLTNTPRPTFTEAVSTPAAPSERRLPPNFEPLIRRFVNLFMEYKTAAACTLLGASTLGLILLFIRKKRP